MDKMKLRLESLKVETFEAVTEMEERGTVQGNEMFLSSPNTCVDTNCGKTYCISSPCAC